MRRRSYLLHFFHSCCQRSENCHLARVLSLASAFIFQLTLLVVVSVSKAEDSTPGAVRRYTVRGIVRDLGEPGKNPRELLVEHQPIQNYLGSDGVESTMPAMTMPFFAAPQIPPADLAVGDEVEMIYESAWTPKVVDRVTRITRLPKGSIH